MIKLQLIGHLGRDVVRKEVNGNVVLNFPVAVNERFRNHAGVLEERTTWVDCSLWNREGLAPYLNQGVLVFVEGAPKSEGYITKNNNPAGALRLRVFQLQLLSRKDDEKRRTIMPEVPAVPEQELVEEQPADDLPF
ncbi:MULTISPECIES: single-stranded DNA-binding protein [Chitinophaga]|uniref:Single-stranded DNA-binding protein n=1 Tax=Chitinophaga flava TaxID=2259036 RepID=A0A365Y1V5_9BACT|nr:MULTISPECIES: single-stranded DNA-binding protein [Chitinophaga]RBL92278.1 single-stranded DNA-binding protein [Chitinophaga flava]